MSGAYSTANDVDVDLGRLFGSLARKWQRILLVSLLVTGAALRLRLAVDAALQGRDQAC